MVPALVFLTALAASALGHHITLVPLAPSPLSRWYTPITASSPYAASMGIAGGLSAAEAAYGAEMAGRALGIHAASASPNAMYAASPAGAFLVPASAVVDSAGRTVGAAEALDAASIFGSAAAFPGSWAAVKSIDAGASDAMLVPISATSPFAANRGSLAHALAAGNSLDSGATTVLMVPVSSTSSLGALRAIHNAATLGSLAHELMDAETIEASGAASSEANPWARTSVATQYVNAFSPASALYASAPMAAYAASMDAAEHAKAADLAAAAYGSPLAARHVLPSYDSSAVSPLFRALAMRTADSDNILASESASPISRWIADAPEPTVAKLVRVSPSIPAAGAFKLARGSPVIPTAGSYASPISRWIADAPEPTVAKLVRVSPSIPAAGAYASLKQLAL